MSQLQDHWSSMCLEAVNVILDEGHDIDQGGMIRITLDDGEQISERLSDAIDYLGSEWNFICIWQTKV